MEVHQIKTDSPPNFTVVGGTVAWPAKFLDLNPIENLWNLVKRKMDNHKPSSKAELLDFFFRQESPNSNVKEWWRACQNA